MIINVRDQSGNLNAKDMLDLDYDMAVAQLDGKYIVKINKAYRYDEEFDNQKDAEKMLKQIVRNYNALEEEIRKYDL